MGQFSAGSVDKVVLSFSNRLKRLHTT